MAHSAQFDFSILAIVKPGIDEALAGTGARLEQYLDRPEANAVSLEAARSELHRLYGVLKMVRLNGVAAFCAELEQVLNELAANPHQVSGMHREVLRQALSALAHYLDALADGADNAALRLFPHYQELQQLRGLEMAFELDLFYPDLDAPLPQAVLNKSLQGDVTVHLKSLRSQYQQGLMRWLRQDDVSAALQLMQQAVENVICCAPPDNGRAFWWIASGLLDCLKFDGLPPELNARKLLGRIDQQMRTIAGSHSGDVEPVLNEMLYLVGRSNTVSTLVETIKQVYALDNYLPELSTSAQEEVAQRLDSLRNRLRAAEEAWEHCAAGDKAACEKFIECTHQLSSKSEKLDHNALGYLIDQIHSLSKYASNPAGAQLISSDMAMALLLSGSGIEHYHHLDSGYQEQARILSERILAAARQQPEDQESLAKLVQLHCRMAQGHVMAPLAREMLANLQHVEHGLNAFFGDTAKPDELPKLLRLLNQIYGGLHLASLVQAEQLLLSVQQNVRRFAQGSNSPKPLESHALANAVSALENYLQQRERGQAGDVAPLLAASAQLDQLQQVPAQKTTVHAEQPHVAADDLMAAARLIEGRTEPETQPSTPAAHAIPGQPGNELPADDELQGLVNQPVTGSNHPGNGAVAEPSGAAQPPVIARFPEPPERPENPANPGKPDVQDDIDEQLLPVFMEEADDLCPKIAAGLRKWREQPHDEQQAQLLKRLLHTLKGSARMAGGMRIGEIVHDMEDRVLAVATLFDQPGYWESLDSDSDRIAELLEELRSGKINVPALDNAAPQRRATDPPGTGHLAERRTLKTGAERALQGDLLRVRSDVVDTLINEAGEIGLACSRMETGMRACKEGMLEMTDSLAHMRKQLHELEIQAGSQMQTRVAPPADRAEQFGALEPDHVTRWQELTRAMNERMRDMQTVQQSLLENIDETGVALSMQARINRALQERLASVRLAPFSSISERLYRVVRQAAKELNKRANLELTGTGVEMDRSVLEKMTAPIEHLLRNAIVHGLEDEQTRRAAGKNPTGEICLGLREADNEIVFEFSDDGAGLNLAALREKAQASGLLQPDEAVSDEQLAQMIFVSGLSTANQVTEMAGRGVGMDVVRSEIAALGGRIDVSSKRGEGTRFTIHLPLTLSAQQIRQRHQQQQDQPEHD